MAHNLVKMIDQSHLGGLPWLSSAVPSTLLPFSCFGQGAFGRSISLGQEGLYTHWRCMWHGSWANQSMEKQK